MNKHYLEYGITLTTDSTFQNKRFGITPELSERLEYLAVECQNRKNKKIIDKLTKLINRYPAVPLLKNFLSVAYNVQGNYNKATEVNHWILKEHPDYFFARLNLANEYMNNNQPERVPEVMGENPDIKALYPERDLFHLAEFTSFMKTVVRYFAAIGNLELAENRYEMLKNIAPDHHHTAEAAINIGALRMLNFKERMEEEERMRISVKVANVVEKTSQSDPPVFIHAVIEELYEHGVSIPKETLTTILNLPRQSLIADLEKVLSDAKNRYGYFAGLEYDYDNLTFPLHALFLLKELNAVESLPAIFEFTGYDGDFVDFWLGDHVTSTLWQCFFSLGKNNLGLLRDFLLKPGIYTYSKVAVSDALRQLIFHHPELREEVKAIFSEVFLAMLRANVNDNLIDTDFIGLTVSATVDCSLKELLPVIKELYEKNYVPLSILGDYQEAEVFCMKTTPSGSKSDVLSIFDFYDHVLTTWAGYQHDENDYDENDYDENDDVDKFFFDSEKPARFSKTGRNEPCPCGSGKKYKKCCML